ncbi:MAG: DUF5397 family protein [Acidithiobacillus ferrivorans]
MALGYTAHDWTLICTSLHWRGGSRYIGKAAQPWTERGYIKKPSQGSGSQEKRAVWWASSIKEGHDTEKGWTVEIEMPQTGERLEYTLKDALDDPEAR